MKKIASTVAALSMIAGGAWADAHAMAMVEALGQDMSRGFVSADKVMAGEKGRLVVLPTDAEMNTCCLYIPYSDDELFCGAHGARRCIKTENIYSPILTTHLK